MNTFLSFNVNTQRIGFTTSNYIKNKVTDDTQLTFLPMMRINRMEFGSRQSRLGEDRNEICEEDDGFDVARERCVEIR